MQGEQAVEMIALDWGTTTVRAYWVTADGEVKAHASAPSGVAVLPPEEFPNVLHELLSPWGPEVFELPVVACGMVGSRNGWHEVPYLGCPATLATVAEGCVDVPFAAHHVTLVPGLALEGEGEADVMRGEETQVFGALGGLQRSGAVMPTSFVLPGTHSKWVDVEGEQLVRFKTYFTGEIFALLQKSTIGVLAAPARGPEATRPLHERDAYLRGLDAAAASPGLLGSVFGVRARTLLGKLDASEVDAYLSGLTIGNELAEVLHRRGGAAAPNVVGIIGNDTLRGAYEVALARFGLTAKSIEAEVTVRGLVGIVQHRYRSRVPD